MKSVPIMSHPRWGQFFQRIFYLVKTWSDMVRAQPKECIILWSLILGLGTNFKCAYKFIYLYKHNFFEPFQVVWLIENLNDSLSFSILFEALCNGLRSLTSRPLNMGKLSLIVILWKWVLEINLQTNNGVAIPLNQPQEKSVLTSSVN